MSTPLSAGFGQVCTMTLRSQSEWMHCVMCFWEIGVSGGLAKKNTRPSHRMWWTRIYVWRVDLSVAFSLVKTPRVFNCLHSWWFRASTKSSLRLCCCDFHFCAMFVVDNVSVCLQLTRLAVEQSRTLFEKVRSPSSATKNFAAPAPACLLFRKTMRHWKERVKSWTGDILSIVCNASERTLLNTLHCVLLLLSRIHLRTLMDEEIGSVIGGRDASFIPTTNRCSCRRCISHCKVCTSLKPPGLKSFAEKVRRCSLDVEFFPKIQSANWLLDNDLGRARRRRKTFSDIFAPNCWHATDHDYIDWSRWLIRPATRRNGPSKKLWKKLLPGIDRAET